MGLVAGVKKAVRDRLIARAGGVDITRLDKVPEGLSWPLVRDGTDPSRRLAAYRDAGPVQKLVSMLGLEVWLVSGDAESRQVLSDATSYSTDIRPTWARAARPTATSVASASPTRPTTPACAAS